jgi:hypothetical protein
MRDPIKKVLALGAAVALMSCSDPPQVMQGKVVSYDSSSKLLVLEDEMPPHLQRSLDLTSADVGGAPAPGNVVRVAYRDRGGKLVAGRVMTLAQKK